MLFYCVPDEGERTIIVVNGNCRKRMTSFHDILGTDDKTGSADVKRRYKLLSSRLHPDKGGSKALMQMIVQAYEKVSAGKGHDEAVRTIQLKDPSAESNNAKLKHLEREFVALKKLNEQLNQQLKEEQEKNRSSNEESERYTNAVEDELKWLRRENRRLNSQLEEARRKVSENTRAIVPSSGSASSLGASVSMDDLAPKVQNQLKALGGFNIRRYGLVLMMPAIIAGLLFTLGKEPWLALLAMFEEPKEKPEAVVTILDTNPVDATASAALSEKQVLNVAPVKPKPKPRIKLESLSGLWQLRFFENNRMPYISVRSEKGSYVVKSCNTGFQYYRNSNLRSGRLSANLIFDRQDRHFMIYNIPYGNGSFAANWSESKSLLINKEYFPNEGFAEAYYQLQQACPY